MPICRKDKEGFFVTTTTEFQVDLADDDSVFVNFQDGNGKPAFVLDLGASTQVNVPTKEHLAKIHKMLDAAWEHWAAVEKKGKA